MKVIPLFKNEKKLIARAAEKNRRAQQELYKKHSGKMLAVCRRYIKDLQQAEEVMLNGFYKVFTHLENFKNEGSFEGWVRRIMVRECISYLRSKKKMEFGLEEIEKFPENFTDLETSFEVEHIQQLIDDLPEGYKMVFVLYAIEGYKHKEIAKMLNIETGTSKSQLYKARQLLQAQLKNQKTTAYVTT
ncbi:MAG TPA: RNA polymerase sigma factor [Salinimicrobium sp.]|nr:RNA polymerase sigma factor [Salinimicrobium sp.]